MKVGREVGPGALLLVNLSGRGDKDVETASAWFGLGEDGPPTDEDDRAVEAGRGADPGPGLDTDQQPTEGAVTNDEAVAGPGAGETA
jgi:tryptophan synthase beta chain